MSTPDPLTTEWVPMWSTFGLQIQDEGVIATSRSVLNFVGAGVTLTDDTTNKRTVITVPGGAPQTPWASNIEAATFQLNNCPMISFIGSSGVSSIGATSNQVTISANGASQALVASANQLVWFSSQNAAVQFSGATSILFYTGVSSVERMRINATGVGIGTNNPLAMLDVNGMIRSTGYVPPTAGAGLELLYTNNSGYLIAYNRSASAYLPLNIVAQSMMIDGQGSAVQFAGNVLLNGGVQYLIDTNHGIKAVAGSGVTLFTFGISSGVFLQQATGNVCVGGTNPNYRLDCRGSMGFQTAIYGNDKEVVQTGDAYLRLNQSGQFSNGVWFGTSHVKCSTGHLYIGTDGRMGGSIDISATAADSVNRISINGNNGAYNWFNTGGMFGINTASPNDPITINGLGQYGNFRMIYGNYGCFFRCDGVTWYFMVTASGDQYGVWNPPYPIQIDLASKGVTIPALTAGSCTVTGACSINSGFSTSGISFMASAGVASDYSNAAIQIRETNRAGGGTSGNNAYAPRISFHWGGVVASQIGMDNSGEIRTFDNPGTGYERFHCGPLTSSGNINIMGIYQVQGIPCARAAIYLDKKTERSLNTVYQNTTGVPTFVAVHVTIDAGSFIHLRTDINNPPANIVFACTNGNPSFPVGGSVNGWVMPNQYYRVFCSSGQLVTWYEWI